MDIDKTIIGEAHRSNAPAGSTGENLALVYQEVLTVISRLRTNRQAVVNARAFRSSMKAALSAAEADAVRKGYTSADARLATFAAVLFLDESIENGNNPLFADWPQMPLQQELFGERASREIFFQCIDRLLSRRDSSQDADVVEVFAQCVLLGYRGQYSESGQEGVRPVLAAITDKVQRIRGPRPLAPDAAPLADAVLPPLPDPWVRPLIFGTLAALFLAGLFFAGVKFALLSGASGLHSIDLLALH
jgi:type IV/VI secretion system ImpK/VasF family protein